MKDPNDTRDIAPRVRSPLCIHMTAVTVAGAAAFGIGMTHLRMLPHLVGLPMFWLLAALVVFGEIWKVITPGRSEAESPAVSVTFSFAEIGRASCRERV